MIKKEPGEFSQFVGSGGGGCLMSRRSSPSQPPTNRQTTTTSLESWQAGRQSRNASTGLRLSVCINSTRNDKRSTVRAHEVAMAIVSCFVCHGKCRQS